MATTEEVKQIKLDSLHVAAFHKRSLFGDLPGLRDSIIANGILEPLIVRPRDRKLGGGYEIGAGVRRLKAATMAELKTVPCIVRELDDEDMIALQVDENRQREGLHPIDEADYCQELAARGMAHEAIGKKLGLKKRVVVQRMALLALGKQARAAFVAGRFDHEAALALAQVGDVARQRDVLAAIDAGTLQPEEIAGYVRRTFTAPLDDVPWRKSDEKLVVKAGACSTCPKRSEVQRDLFPEAKGSRCLDVDCWRGKMEASWAIAVAKPGVTLLDQPAESLFAPSSSGRPTVLRSSGMVDQGALCPLVDNYTWGEALEQAMPEGAEPPALYIARDLDGRPRFIYREAIVAKIVKKSDLAKSKAEARVAQDPHREGDPPAGEASAQPSAAASRAEGKIRRRFVSTIAERVLAGDMDTWTWVVARLLDQLTPRAVSAAAELLGPAIRQLDPPADGAAGLVQLAGESTRQARRVATAALVFEVADVVGEVVEPIRELAELCGIDLAAIDAEVRK